MANKKEDAKKKKEESPKSFAENRKAQRESLRAMVVKDFGKGSSGLASETLAQYTPRISTGSFDVDRAMGGGWPRGRICLSWGATSSGKTTTMIRTLADAQKRDAITNRYIKHMPKKMQAEAVPMVCAWIDCENTFDRRWAVKLGVDLDNLEFCVPNDQDEACTLIVSFILSGAYDCVFLDSLAVMSPIDEIEGEMGDHHIGLAARKNNKMLRKVQAALNRSSREGRPPPTLFLINQERQNIGVMFGPKKTKPGGNGQNFYSSVILHLSGQKMEYYDTEKKYPKFVEMYYKIDKNKTYPPNIHGKMKQSLVDDPDGLFEAGDIIETAEVMELAMKVGIYKKTASNWVMFDKTYNRKKDLAEEWISNKENFGLLKGILMTNLFPHQAKDWEATVVQEEKKETKQPVEAEEDS